MGIDIAWVDESGKEMQFISDAEGGLMSFILESGGLEGTACLRFIEPFGDTIFNQRQIAVLVAELEAVASRKHEPQTSQQLERILRLARTAQGKTHTYIKFIGD